MDEARQVKIFFFNGNVYEGRIYKRIMNGKGKFTWSDGSAYEVVGFCFLVVVKESINN